MSRKLCNQCGVLLKFLQTLVPKIKVKHYRCLLLVTAVTCAVNIDSATCKILKTNKKLITDTSVDGRVILKWIFERLGGGRRLY